MQETHPQLMTELSEGCGSGSQGDVIPSHTSVTVLLTLLETSGAAGGGGCWPGHGLAVLTSLHHVSSLRWQEEPDKG